MIFNSSDYIPAEVCETEFINGFTLNGLVIDTWLMKAVKPYYQMVAYCVKDNGDEFVLGRHDIFKLEGDLEHALLGEYRDFQHDLRNNLFHGLPDTHLIKPISREDMVIVRSLIEPPYKWNASTHCTCDKNYEIPWVGNSILKWTIHSKKCTDGDFIQSVRFFTTDVDNNERGYTVIIPPNREPYVFVNELFAKYQTAIIETLGLKESDHD